MIEVKDISKSFGEKHVLKGISLVAETGKATLVIGGSGQGKTVLMRAIVGLEEVDSGSIIYDGRNFSEMNTKDRKSIRKEIGMLFQGSALFDSQTVEENVMFPLSMFTEMSEQEKLDRVNFCLKRVNLENKNSSYPSEISGGQKKRVGIARAIALNPKYLFCDEPNSGLDPLTAHIIDELIQEITHEFNITTLINTHDMNSVINIGAKVIFIYQGKKWWEGTSKEILTTDNKEVSEFIGTAKTLNALRK
ncbi:MAG TPA: ATP-binding cassette domain-containing protein [Bacteroidia bacterium]|jgi:phospholipid/cholesterol/gamma-HCH transport system ATP-binding protein|nr:ATP-binding cassette domain-containing protein [Bacteroidia bacterium]HNO71693.1 ATP-binding cassette domain-containing protein [Bacteroidia bacterium]